MELLKIQLQDAGRVAALEAKSSRFLITVVTIIFIGFLIPKAGKANVPIKISATKIVTHIVKERGIGGLFKGLVATWARDIPFCVVYFPLFATLDARGPRKTDGSGWFYKKKQKRHKNGYFR